MKQKDATIEDVNNTMKHVINLRKLEDQGFYETILFVYRRGIVPVGFAPRSIRGLNIV